MREKFDGRFKWTCNSCSRRPLFAFDTLRECQKDQIRHAKRYHSDHPGYQVVSQGRVIYRVP